MNITVNGKDETVPDGLSIAAFFQLKNICSEYVVVERNEKIVKRDNWDTEMVSTGDILEIVHFVGGG